MRKERALRHLLELQIPGVLGASGPSLASALVVTHDRGAKAFLVGAEIGGRKGSVRVPEDELVLYDHGDRPAPPAVAAANAAVARRVLGELAAACGRGPATAEPGPLPATGAPSARVGLALAVVVAATAATFTYVRGTSTFNLVDNTYTLEAAWRIRSGEVPYRDFVLVVAPGTYAVQALLLLLSGDRAVAGLLWCVAVQAATVLLTHHILRRLDVPPLLAPVLCLVPAFGGHAVLPNVWYDVDAILAALAGVALLLQAERRRFAVPWMVLAGAAAAVPAAFKQNIGVAHAAVSGGLVAGAWLLGARGVDGRRAAAFAGGMLAGFAAWMAPLVAAGGLDDFLGQAVILAGKLRGHMTLAELRRWYLPRIAADMAILDLFVYSLGWLAPLVALPGFLLGRRRAVELLLPLWIWAVSVAAIYAEGPSSVMPLAPLLALLGGHLCVSLRAWKPVRLAAPVTAGLVALLVAQGQASYALSGRRLLFYRQPLAEPAPFASERLRGLSIEREMRDVIDEAVAFLQALPPEATFALYPTEDPLFFATGRRSPLRLLQTLPPTGGDDAAYQAELARAQPDYVLVKTLVQGRAWQPASPELASFLATRYRPHATLRGYQVLVRAGTDGARRPPG